MRPPFADMAGRRPRRNIAPRIDAQEVLQGDTHSCRIIHPAGGNGLGFPGVSDVFAIRRAVWLFGTPPHPLLHYAEEWSGAIGAECAP